MKDLLVYAIGNPGRQDDGLGYEFILNLAPAGEFDRVHNYQLNVEDAELISHYKRVLFVDAGKNMELAYELRPLEASLSTAFSTHGLSFESVLAMTNELYDHRPLAQLLAIKGVDFELEMGLTPSARNSLLLGLRWFEQNMASSN